MMEHQTLKQLLVITTRSIVEDVDLPLLTLICVSDMCEQCLRSCKSDKILVCLVVMITFSQAIQGGYLDILIE